MKEWIKASKGFPIEGQPESLIGMHCRWARTEQPFQFLSLGAYGNFRYCMDGQCKSQYVNDCIDNIEWLKETQEEPKTNNDSKVMSPKEWYINKYPGIDLISDADYEDMRAYASYVLQHSASRPEIKLPEIKNETIIQYREQFIGWNNCIEEIKQLNGITE